MPIESRPAVPTRGFLSRVMLVLAVAVGAACTVPDVVQESRELGRAGRHIDAVDRLERAAREGTRSEHLRAELLRQQESSHGTLRYSDCPR